MFQYVYPTVKECSDPCRRRWHRQPWTASNNLFAMLCRREPAEVAGMVLIATGTSFVTLPLLLIYLL